jgi:hypothetical protein
MFIFLLYRIYLFYEVMHMKYAANMVYIYFGIIAINTFVNIILLGIFEMEIVHSLISSNSVTEIGSEKIILHIDQGKENPYLIQTRQEADPNDLKSKNEIDSVYVNKDESKEKNFNPLKDLHKRLLFADKSHFPSYFQKDCLPKISENAPVYGNKLVTFKPSSLLQDRNLPEMSIEIPKTRSIGKLTELHKAIDGADEAVKLYDSQFIKFNEVLSGIQSGTEKFYPDEAKSLMETYVDLVTILSNQQKVMANEAINQLHQLDSRFSRELYLVNSSRATPEAVIAPVPETGSGAGVVNITAIEKQ